MGANTPPAPLRHPSNPCCSSHASTLSTPGDAWGGHPSLPYLCLTKSPHAHFGLALTRAALPLSPQMVLEPFNTAFAAQFVVAYHAFR